MADKSTQLVLAALSQAAAAGPSLLHPNRSTPGLFPGSAPGKQAARRCQEEGWLRVAAGAVSRDRTDTNGNSSPPRFAITDAGVRHLLGQMDPRQVLEDFVRVLEGRQQQVEELLALAQQMQAGLATLDSHTRTVLERIVERGAWSVEWEEEHPGANGRPTHEWEERLLAHLEQYHDANTSRDCPLPHLFGLLAREAPGLTVGRFHDALRRLHDGGAIYLHPWTGPLYEVPEPSCALLVGHEIAYYVSTRKG